METALPPMDSKGLRDHSEHILRAVVEDMQRPQSERQQIAKSLGHGPDTEGDSPAQPHAMTRFVAGFSMDQMMSEYRALRSRVLRLWLAQQRVDDEHDVQDIIRFNEAIDQALVVSIARYGEAVESTRKTVFGVLGHDLRSPLGAVLMASDMLRKNANMTDRDRRLAEQINASISRANHMVGYLLDLARSNLGAGIPVNPEDTDLSIVCASVIEELRTAFPQAKMVSNVSERVRGGMIRRASNKSSLI
ncbi:MULTISPECIES: sensor histidine kinase [unclassified Pseudomonas]